MRPFIALFQTIYSPKIFLPRLERADSVAPWLAGGIRSVHLEL